MTAASRGLEKPLLALFMASGFAGLVYQSIWSHYLGLSLGHAAYAQTLVLAIFMGGMALGAWLVARFGGRWQRLIFAYAVVEAVIGLAGLGFHPLFVATGEFSQQSVYPALSAAGAVRVWQWGSAALLIAPQSIFMGMAFPLMSGGYLRQVPGADGEVLGGLYFTNGLGAAIGALVATFVLLPWIGMPGAVAAAGFVNLAVAFGAWRLSRQFNRGAGAVPGTPSATASGMPSVPPADARPEARADAPPPAWPTASVGTRSPSRGFGRLMLLAAGITGASSFVYEIAWVRMLNQALGSTVHSFELMLAAFVLGLAFGGLWVRRRSRRIADVVAGAGYVQVFMGIAALASLPVFAQSFRWVGALVAALPKTDAGYALFGLGSAGIAVLVMFPAAFFAGMTLPLFTMALLRRGHGEASIGRIYAANTLGAIVGVMLAVHVLIPRLGLHLAVTAAALADIALGLVLLGAVARVRARPWLLAACAGGLALLLAHTQGHPHPYELASGVFRHGQARLADGTRMLFLRDGKTATIAVFRQGDVGTISTNGKPDASLQLDTRPPDSADEVTMLMAAALPLAIHPAPREIAVIGWGSGLTTHTLLGSAAPTRVDSIEIEPAMVEGAKLFGDRVARAYGDPRSHLHVDDARMFFSTGRRRYDVIVSEPSNPWVNGVAALFTRQFYRRLGAHLRDDGLLVQWLQTYELDDALLATMLAALAAEFPHVEVYLTNTADLLFVASRQPLPALDAGRIREAVLRGELARVRLVGTGDYAARHLGSGTLVRTLVAMAGATPHSDFHPVVALRAPAARFLGRNAGRPLALATLGLPILEMTGGPPPIPESVPVLYSPHSVPSQAHWIARGIRATLLTGAVDSRLSDIEAVVLPSVRTLMAKPAAPGPEWLEAVARVAENSLARLPPADLRGLWIEPVWIDAAAQPGPVRQVLAAYDAAARRAPAEMRRHGLEALHALDDDAPVLLRQQMLMIALLGASHEGGADAVAAIERAEGRDVVETGAYAVARAYLRAWVTHGHAPRGACLTPCRAS